MRAGAFVTDLQNLSDCFSPHCGRDPFQATFVTGYRRREPLSYGVLASINSHPPCGRRPLQAAFHNRLITRRELLSCARPTRRESFVGQYQCSTTRRPSLLLRSRIELLRRMPFAEYGARPDVGVSDLGSCLTPVRLRLRALGRVRPVIPARPTHSTLRFTGPTLLSKDSLPCSSLLA